MLKTLTVIFIVADLHQIYSSPIYKGSPSGNSIPILISHETVHLPTVHVIRKQKGPNLPVIPLQHQILIPKFHVIPAQSNVHHSSIHTNVNHFITSDNVKIPVVTQTVSHTSSNVTHPAHLLPIFIPIHHNLVPVHDVSVIPLQNNVRKIEKLGHYRVAMEQKEDGFEEPNRYRTFYGGYGTGLFFGGQGAGHGYYAYGK